MHVALDAGTNHHYTEFVYAERSFTLYDANIGTEGINELFSFQVKDSI